MTSKIISSQSIGLSNPMIMMGHDVFRRYFYLILCLVLIGNDDSFVFKQNLLSIIKKQQQDFLPKTTLIINNDNNLDAFKQHHRRQRHSIFSLYARKRFILGEKEIIISCVVSKFSNPSSTRLVPPITWLTSSGSRVKVLHSVTKPGSTTSTSSTASNDNLEFESFDGSLLSTIDKTQKTIKPKSVVVQSSVLEISVPRKRIDETLMNLRTNGFKKQDIYRMLDKGPWTLAFDVPGPLTKLLADLEVNFDLDM